MPYFLVVICGSYSFVEVLLQHVIVVRYHLFAPRLLFDVLEIFERWQWLAKEQPHFLFCLIVRLAPWSGLRSDLFSSHRSEVFLQLVLVFFELVQEFVSCLGHQLGCSFHC